MDTGRTETAGRLRRAARATLVLLVSAFVMSSSAPAASESSTPKAGGPFAIKDLFRAGFLDSANLSPNGKNIAAIYGDDDDNRSLVVMSVENGEGTRIKGDGGHDIYSFRWLDNSRLIFNALQENHYAYGIFVANLRGWKHNFPVITNSATQIIGLPTTRPNRALVWVRQSAWEEGTDGGLTELELSRSTGDAPSSGVVTHNYAPPKPGIVVGWTAGVDGDVARCYLYDQGKSVAYRYLRDTGGWERINLDLATSSIVRDDPDNRHIWVSDYADGAFRLRRYDPVEDQYEPSIIQDENYDLSGARIFFTADDKLAGFTYTQRRERSVWLNPTYASAQYAVDQRHPDTDNVLVDVGGGDKLFLYRCTSATEPGRYLLLNLKAGSLNEIANSAPQLEKYALIQSKVFSWRTRDGLKLEGYLTLPPGTSKDHPVPLVVLVHGGPTVRDTWAFDAEVQMLASRGYAVLQPNYRGSTGYAPTISGPETDFRHMHDDVTDATRAAMGTGLVDPHRIAIMGGSFGGYLSLCGAAFEPDLYRCAISLCGVFDWERLVASKREHARPGEFAYLKDKVGYGKKDREYFESISPMSHVDAIHIPILIAHGEDDSIVDVAQSKRLAAALAKRGISHETFYRKLESHGFYDFDNRVAYYETVEAFLAKYMPATAE